MRSSRGGAGSGSLIYAGHRGEHNNFKQTWGLCPQAPLLLPLTNFSKFLMGTPIPLKKKAKHLSVIPFVSKTRSGWEADLESAQIYKGDQMLAIMAA